MPGSNCDIGSYEFQAPKDTTPPSCNLTGVIAGPPKRIQITVQDAGDGLASTAGGTFTSAPSPAGGIQLTALTNGSVAIPAVTSGTTTPVVVTITKVNQSAGTTGTLLATDVAGNTATCDPSFLTIGKDPGVPATHTFTNVPQAEHTLTIVNDKTEGLRRLEVKVNGGRPIAVELSNGETKTLDLSASPGWGKTNTVQVSAHGDRPDETATVMLSG